MTQGGALFDLILRTTTFPSTLAQSWKAFTTSLAWPGLVVDRTVSLQISSLINPDYSTVSVVIQIQIATQLSTANLL
ncbi:hypothetical protein EDB82DRAFT_483642 [Fusarium venenatum]|uniref:uncharacterized protein n=1 Tax=Fusarium venenatum TaxID=56646 RepID=UPI001D6B79C5|nr:hypothetical protein EDB82DRAFT_483642 [Fusarium venenatum]